MDKTLEWLKQISEVPGVSGYEQRVKAMLTLRLGNLTEVSGDRIGSVIFKKMGSAENPRIMLASPMDEIGFMV